MKTTNAGLALREDPALASLVGVELLGDHGLGVACVEHMVGKRAGSTLQWQPWSTGNVSGVCPLAQRWQAVL
jgi:hypothetical protein